MLDETKIITYNVEMAKHANGANQLHGHLLDTVCDKRAGI